MNGWREGVSTRCLQRVCIGEEMRGGEDVFKGKMRIKKRVKTLSRNVKAYVSILGVVRASPTALAIIVG